MHLICDVGVLLFRSAWFLICLLVFIFGGASKADECQKMIEGLDKVVEELLNIIACAECVDKSDQLNLQGWLRKAEECRDIAIDGQSLGKGAIARFKNYLSS